MEKRKALGRGLDALIPEASTFSPGADITGNTAVVTYLNINDISPNKYQPREDFNEEKLNDLIASIKEKGVVQPLLVRRVESGYELIAGERRLRAMKALGTEKAPVILKEANDVEAIELALIENIQREGLNTIEEAHTYKRLIDEFGFTQEKVSQTIGKDRTSVTNTLRLLNLPLQIQRYLVGGKISTGHARALLSIKGLQRQLNVCEKVIKKSLSVRETEALANPQLRKHSKNIAEKDRHLIEQEELLQGALATKVRIHHGKKRGKIVIEYYSLEDLGRIINKIGT